MLSLLEMFTMIVLDFGDYIRTYLQYTYSYITQTQSYNIAHNNNKLFIQQNIVLLYAYVPGTHNTTGQTHKQGYHLNNGRSSYI